jgi:hypothetical protein
MQQADKESSKQTPVLLWRGRIGVREKHVQLHDIWIDDDDAAPLVGIEPARLALPGCFRTVSNGSLDCTTPTRHAGQPLSPKSMLTLASFPNGSSRSPVEPCSVRRLMPSSRLMRALTIVCAKNTVSTREPVHFRMQEDSVCSMG